MVKVKLSIVIPVYNVDKYIEKCIRSLENQDLSRDEYELIVINDGSTDQSPQIIKNLQKEFNNLILIHKENGGLSSARNLGIKHARGKYIWFFDSDDYAEPNVLKKLINRAEKDNLDLLAFNCYRIQGEKETSMFLSVKKQPTTVISGEFYIQEFFIGISAWFFFCKKEILEDHNLLFVEGIIHEDFEFILRLYRHIKRMAFEPIRVYNYVSRDGSITTTRTHEQALKSIHSWQTIIKLRSQDFKDCSSYSKSAQVWINHNKFSALATLFFNKLPLSEKKQEFKTLKEIGAFRIGKIKTRNLKLKFICRILQIPCLFYFLMHFFKRSFKN